MKFSDRKASNRNKVVNMFADFFQTVYVDDDDNDGTDPSANIDQLVNIGSLSLTHEIILEALQNINTSKGDGPNNISPLLLKNCSYALTIELHFIYNLSLSSQIYANKWKLSYLMPIHKRYSHSDFW